MLCSYYVVNILIINKICDIILNRKRDDNMASLTSAINVNVDAKLKEEATKILKDLGLNMSTFINMALAQVVKKDGVPFEVVNPKPSKELLEALNEGEEILNGKIKAKGYHNVRKMFEDIMNED